MSGGWGPRRRRRAERGLTKQPLTAADGCLAGVGYIVKLVKRKPRQHQGSPYEHHSLKTCLTKYAINHCINEKVRVRNNSLLRERRRSRTAANCFPGDGRARRRDVSLITLCVTAHTYAAHRRPIGAFWFNFVKILRLLVALARRTIHCSREKRVNSRNATQRYLSPGSSETTVWRRETGTHVVVRSLRHPLKPQ